MTRKINGSLNPNWKGGPIDKVCGCCGKDYIVRRAQARSRFCSLQCVGVSQRGTPQKPRTSVAMNCIECGKEFFCPPSRLHVARACSQVCRIKHHGTKTAGPLNPNWHGGLSRKPYPYNFRQISRAIQERDGFKCRGIECRGQDSRLTAHHINYNKEDCDFSNLITLCSSCNTLANFGRPRWQSLYSDLMSVSHRVPELKGDAEAA